MFVCKRGRERDIQRKRDTFRDRERHSETERDIQRQRETFRDRERLKRRNSGNV